MGREGEKISKDLGEGKNVIKINLNFKIVLNNENIIKNNSLPTLPDNVLSADL